MPILEMTYKIAHAAGRDAGNRSMKEAGRTVWNKKDRQVALDEFNRLMPKAKEIEMEHTPGPWKVHTHSHINHEQWLSVLHGAWDVTHNGASNPAIVACSKYSAMTDQENLANARLMAAAPDLLEACKAAYTNKTLGEYECQKQGLPRHIEVLEKLAQAIAKAKGD